MSDGDQGLDEFVRHHQRLRRSLPNAWNAFFARFGSLRPVQLQTIPPVLAGKNVLITAPTAGGKTEAVAAPVCERMVSGRWPALSVLLITPTRALVNDLFHRLERPCGDMRVRLGRKTADHAVSQEIKEQLLITTPESTESLLTFRREALLNVRTVIIDEIHLLDGSPRGDQLRMILSRLQAYLRHKHAGRFGGLQTVAMSATVPDPRRMADTYLGAASELVCVPGQRQLDARVIVTGGPEAMRARAAVDAFEHFADVNKVLVFVNSRKQVDEGAGHFRHGAFANAPVLGHHGSLSKQQRELTEGRFKREGRGICVATMTLEVGIDIGDVDLVVCMDPPFSLASFLQRIGRGCRRLAGRTRVLCVARDRAGELMFEAMIRQASLGLPVGPHRPFRSSVLVQQSLAYLKQVDGNCRTVEQFERVLTSAAHPPVTAERLRAVLDDLVRQGVLDRRGQVLQPASAGWEFIQSHRVYGNIAPAPMEVSLVDADTGNVVATVAAVSGRHVQVAGRSYELLPGGHRGQHKVRGTQVNTAGGPPRYHPRKLPYAPDLGAALAGRLGIPSDRLAVVSLAGGGIAIGTWLGQLLNTALGEGLTKSGRSVTAGPFAIVVDGATPDAALPLIGEAVRAVCAANPLDQVKVEQLVDMGPHLDALSPELREAARRDWLDTDYLQGWATALKAGLVVPAASDLGSDLLTLFGLSC